MFSTRQWPIPEKRAECLEDRNASTEMGRGSNVECSPPPHFISVSLVDSSRLLPRIKCAIYFSHHSKEVKALLGVKYTEKMLLIRKENQRTMFRKTEYNELCI